jgi:hypothetical protein
MLTHPTLNRLVTLGLSGMAKAFDEQQRQPDITALGFEERFALLVDREATERENKRLVNRLRFAKLRQNAVVEDIDIKAPRGLDKALFQKLIHVRSRPTLHLRSCSRWMLPVASAPIASNCRSRATQRHSEIDRS